MKKIILNIIVIFITNNLNAQSRLNIGGGYFGETITHPGLVLELEYETNIRNMIRNYNFIYIPKVR